MNDRYLFKAKRVDDGEWVIGYLFRISEKHEPFIMLCDKHAESYAVDSNTLCQCTGLKDKNGKLIWENDIVDCSEEECCGKIMWSETECGFYFDVLLEDGTYEEEHIYDYLDYLEVIGNIFDNPELLEIEE